MRAIDVDITPLMSLPCFCYVLARRARVACACAQRKRKAARAVISARDADATRHAAREISPPPSRYATLMTLRQRFSSDATTIPLTPLTRRC